MNLVATIDVHEPWWAQIIKSLVIFAVILQLVPVVDASRQRHKLGDRLIVGVRSQRLERLRNGKRKRA